MTTKLGSVLTLLACAVGAPVSAQPADADLGAPAAASRPAASAEVDARPVLEPSPRVAFEPDPPAAIAPQVPPPAVDRVSGVPRSGNALDLGTTSITGNQELPKVLYIVPWKRSDLADLVGRPVNTLLDEVLAPIDPDVFERHLDYYGLLYAEGAAGRAAPGRAETEEE